MYRKPKQQAIQKEIPKVQTRSEIKQWMQTNSIAFKGTKKKEFQDSQKFNGNKKKPESFNQKKNY